MEVAVPAYSPSQYTGKPIGSEPVPGFPFVTLVANIVEQIKPKTPSTLIFS